MTEDHQQPREEEQSGGSARPPEEGSADPPVAPAELPGAVTGMVAGMASVADSTAGLWQLADEQVTELLEAAGEARRQQERLIHALVVEVLQRGINNPCGLTVAEFVSVKCPWLSPVEQRRLARVAQAAREARNAPIAESLTQGTVSLERAEKVLRWLERIRRYVDDGAYAEYATALLPLAQMGADRELRQAGQHLVALVTPEPDTEELAKARAESAKVYESSLSTGLRRFIIETDPEGAAMLRSVFSSELTKPVPDENGADLRSPGRRRHDALMTVLQRGMSSPDPSAPNGAPVQLLLTASFDLLRQQVAGYGSAALGAGDIETLSPGQLRRLACQAEMVPFVLGGRSEVLDQGRKRRCATPAQRRALWIRDGGCTFPACTMPAQWTEVHHARVWWSRGGLTDVADMALLCRRHHSWVHSHDPEVTMTSTGPVWHLDRCHGTGRGERPTLHTDRAPARGREDENGPARGHEQGRAGGQERHPEWEEHRDQEWKQRRDRGRGERGGSRAGRGGLQARSATGSGLTVGGVRTVHPPDQPDGSRSPRGRSRRRRHHSSFEQQLAAWVNGTPAPAEPPGSPGRPGAGRTRRARGRRQARPPPGGRA